MKRLSAESAKKHVAMLLVTAMVFLTVSADIAPAAYGAENVVTVNSKADLPLGGEIAADKVYELAADVTLTGDEQLASIAGTLDGKGHTVTLGDKPLANEVTGTVQNLGVKGSLSTADETWGSIAKTQSGGVIQNCWSTATIASSGFFTDEGGLVGTFSSPATIKNSYFAGTVPYPQGGIIGSGNGGTITDSYYTDNCNDAYGMAFNTENYHARPISADELKTSAAVKKLNNNIPETGYYWVLPVDGGNGGFPVLKAGSLSDLGVDKDSLRAAVSRADALGSDGSAYEDDGWRELQEALREARGVLEAPDAGQRQEEIDAATQRLEEALSSLVKKKPVSPVAPQGDAVHITEVADLTSIGTGAGKYYVLDNDISIKASDWYFPLDDFEGIFDGQGHTVTFDNASLGLFSSIAAEGVVQNVHFSGTLGNNVGPAASSVKGSVINCYSDVTGDLACGLGKYLDGGHIINCYSRSEGKIGVLFKDYNSGKLVNTYWQSGLSNPPTGGSVTLQASSAKTADEMKDYSFTELLNANRGEYGTKWGQNEDGYPYFGEDKAPHGPESEELPENKYPLSFTPYNSEAGKTVSEKALDISTDDTDPFHKAGTFALSGVSPGSTIKWSLRKVSPERSFMIGEESGELYVYEPGSALLYATEEKGDGYSQEVAAIKLTSYAKNVQDFKIYAAGRDVTGKSIEVSGSEWVDLSVFARYEGSEEYVEAAARNFTFSLSDETHMKRYSDTSPSFYFTRPGTGSVTVTSKQNAALSKKADFNSSYVEAVSVRPAISGTRTIHGRNANSEGGKLFNSVDLGSAIVEPENASYRDNVTIESGDDTVGGWAVGYGYFPRKAGTVTYTARLTDPQSGAGLTGSSKVTYEYLNPLISVKSGSSAVTLPAYSQLKLDLEFTGEKSGEGYSVTEPELVWTFDKEGIADIDRRKDGGWKRDPSAPDNNMYLPLTDYYVYGLSEGTVTATGTPVDDTRGAKPVVLTITVTKSDAKPLDMDALADKGVTAAAGVIEAQLTDKPEYQYEWLVYTLLRSGRGISQKALDHYYASVAAEVKGWDENTKATDLARVMLTLSAMGKDVTDVDGVDLTRILCGNNTLTDGSNEAAWALIALDARHTAVPEGSAYDRKQLIDAILTFQNDDGGFSLGPGGGSGIDTTAMALQALAPYVKDDPRIEQAVNGGLSYLKDRMSPSYNFDGSSEAIAQVILTLTALGKDPADPKNGFGNQYANLISALMEYYDEDAGGFLHVMGGRPDMMAAIQAMQALDSYRMLKAGDSSYWDLSEATVPPAPSDDDNGGGNGTGTGNGSGSNGNGGSDGSGSGNGAGDAGSGTVTGIGTSADAAGDDGGTAPGTGDESGLCFWLLAMAFALLTAASCFVRREK